MSRVERRGVLRVRVFTDRCEPVGEGLAVREKDYCD